MILVVRTAGELERTMAAVETRLAGAGKEVPIMGVEALVFKQLPLPDNVPQTDGVLFTSVHGVLAADKLPRIVCWCVGARTAEVARAHGWPVSGYGDGDGVVMVNAMLKKEKNAKTWLHVCGKSAGESWYDLLHTAGHAVVRCEAYTMTENEHLPAQVVGFLRQAVNHNAPLRMLLMSCESADGLHRALEQVRLSDAERVPPYVAYVISPAVAETAKPWCGRVVVADKPSLAAMVDALVADMKQ